MGMEASKNKILKIDMETWRLKSQAIWINQGDCNSNFFHNMPPTTKKKFQYGI